MTPDQIKAIQESFAKVAPISEQAAALFYGRLFEIAPAVKPLFRGDMKEQGRKLMATLAVVVNGLGKLEAVLPAASALAKRHVGLRRKGRCTTRRSARRCCGRWNAVLARNGRRSSRRLGRGLWRALRVHDRRSLRPQRRGRMRSRVHEQPPACAARGRRQRNGGNADGRGAAVARSRPLRHHRHRRRTAPQLQPHPAVLGAGGRQDARRDRHQSAELVRRARHSLDRRKSARRRSIAPRAKSLSPTERSSPTTSYCWPPARNRWRRRFRASACPTCAPSATSPMSRR